LWTFGIQPNVVMLSSVTHSAFVEVQYVQDLTIVQSFEYPAYIARLSARLLVVQSFILVQIGDGLNM
jgi:hypothetical protein